MKRLLSIFIVLSLGLTLTAQDKREPYTLKSLKSAAKPQRKVTIGKDMVSNEVVSADDSNQAGISWQDFIEQLVSFDDVVLRTSHAEGKAFRVTTKILVQSSPLIERLVDEAEEEGQKVDQVKVIETHVHPLILDILTQEVPSLTELTSDDLVLILEQSNFLGLGCMITSKLLDKKEALLSFDWNHEQRAAAAMLLIQIVGLDQSQFNFNEDNTDLMTEVVATIDRECVNVSIKGDDDKAQAFFDRIDRNPELAFLVHNLTIEDCEKLTDLGRGLTSISGKLDIYLCPQLVSLGGLRSVGGDCEMHTLGLQNLGMLHSVGGSLYLGSMHHLVSLGKLRSVGGNVMIDTLQLLRGLGVLSVVHGKLTINRCHTLMGLGSLDRVQGQLDISNCKKLRGVGALHSVGGLRVRECPQLVSLGGLQIVDGDLRLSEVRSFKSFGSLEFVGGNIIIQDSPNFRYFGGLKFIGGEVSVQGEDELDAQLKKLAEESRKQPQMQKPTRRKLPWNKLRV